jgi:putative endonuclease
MAPVTIPTPVNDANKRAKGRLGEDAAAEYLLGLGYSIITRNYQAKQGEIDIIAQDHVGTLVFVEVKAAFGRSCGNPLFRVTRGKQRTIITLAKRWMYEHKMTGRPCRFDVIGIQNGKIDHLKNAYLG